MRHADLVVDHVDDPTVDHVKDPAVDLVEDLAVDQEEDQDLGNFLIDCNLDSS